MFVHDIKLGKRYITKGGDCAKVVKEYEQNGEKIFVVRVYEYTVDNDGFVDDDNGSEYVEENGRLLEEV